MTLIIMDMKTRAFQLTSQQLEGRGVKLVYRGIDVYGCPAILAGQRRPLVIRHGLA